MIDRDRLRRLAAAVAYGSLRASGATGLLRRLRRAPVILCYHNIVGDADAAAGEPGLHMPRSRFEGQMRWLAAHYEIVPARELVAAPTLPRTGRPRAAVTFDDAYAGVLEHAIPVLRRLRVPATIFALSEY
jgi:peptidoglycan/xylan/chitin deacetylase (PgdA/CDA1 family)